MITVDDCKLHCRVDHDADDTWFETMIEVVRDAVENWLGDETRMYENYEDSHGDIVFVTDSHGDPLLLPIVRGAMLIEISMQYKNREGGDQASIPAHWGHGYVLGLGATSLLTGLRKTRVS